MNLGETQSIIDFDKKAWAVVNKLLPMLDAAIYEHVVLGSVFLKYAPDAFKKLKGLLEMDCARKQVAAALPGFTELITEIPFHHDTLKAKNILGDACETR